ncbi:MAG: ABC transporter permease [Deltaproteobacteria bacterium]|nr:MAG: ABC transporter permease [Deltaproteobacteria bacterium]
MDKLAATFIKELRLLFRDRAGLLLLFVMPAALVVVITLVQANVMKPMADTGIRILMADQDGGDIGRRVADGFTRSGGFQVDQALGGKSPGTDACRAAVAAGAYQFCIVVPDGMSRALTIAAVALVEKADVSGKENATVLPGAAEIKVYSDPMVQGGFKAAVTGVVRQVAGELAMAARLRVLADHISRRIDEELRPVVGPAATDIAATIKKAMTQAAIGSHRSGRQPDEIIRVTETPTGRGRFSILPTAVQHNVPAWALFGMFFIVVPLAGSLIKERSSGTFSRILTMPVSPLVLIAGKMAAYTLVCMTQFALVVVIGKTVLPFLGTDVLRMGPSIGAVVGVAFASSLAATAYGVMLGTVARSYEQAATLGPISVVIAAALGGIMVPVFAMPKVLRMISAFSPLAWSHGAFLELFLRGGSLIDVWRQLVWLFLFFCVNLGVAWAVFRRRGK